MKLKKHKRGLKYLWLLLILPLVWLGYISNDLDIDKLEQKYYISDIVKRIYDVPDFSRRLRHYLESLPS